MKLPVLCHCISMVLLMTGRTSKSNDHGGFFASSFSLRGASSLTRTCDFLDRRRDHPVPFVLDNHCGLPNHYWRLFAKPSLYEKDDDNESSLTIPPEVVRPLFLLLASQFLLFIGVGAVIPSIPLYGKEIGLSSAANGIVISAPAVALLLAANWSGRQADAARKPAMMIGMAIIAVSDFGTALATTLPVLILARLGLGWGRALSEAGERGMLVDLANQIPFPHLFFLTTDSLVHNEERHLSSFINSFHFTVRRSLTSLPFRTYKKEKGRVKNMLQSQHLKSNMMQLLRVLIIFLAAPIVQGFQPQVPTPSRSLQLKATKYDRCDVAVCGGGFGGLYTALAISREARKRRIRVDIALVDPSDRFVFLPLLYDLTMGTATEGEVCPKYEELLEGTGIRHIRSSFDSITSNADGSEPLSSARLLMNRPTDVSESSDDMILSFQALVVAVGATPQSVLASVPGAAEFAQPFYTRKDAYATRDILFQMDQKIQRGEVPKLAVVGGGYGGVELAACLARRLPKANVTLITRGPPMKATRAEPLVNQALQKLNVVVEMCNVEKIVPIGDENEKQLGRRVKIQKSPDGTEDAVLDSDEAFDTVFWTAGSASAHPVPGNTPQLAVTDSGRLQVDKTLQCSWSSDILNNTITKTSSLPFIWALGDCSEMVPSFEPAIPRTAQAAMQQADVVASNVLSRLDGRNDLKTFKFQDLGTVLSLGGPNGAVLGPQEEAQLGPLVVPLLDTARFGLAVADKVLEGIINSPQVDKKSAEVVENLGLSLGGYGLGVDPQTTPGTISGTLSGISRRAIYALRQPTDRQRAYAAASSFLSSAAALAKEASDQYQQSEQKKR